MENIALAEPGAQLSIWALFMQASWVVKLVMIGLLCASVWTWAIIVDKLVAYARMRLSLNRFEQVFWSGQSLEELYRTLADRKTTGMGAIFVAAMREWKKSFEKGAKSPLGLQTGVSCASGAHVLQVRSAPVLCDGGTRQCAAPYGLTHP